MTYNYLLKLKLKVCKLYTIYNLIYEFISKSNNVLEKKLYKKKMEIGIKLNSLNIQKKALFLNINVHMSKNIIIIISNLLFSLDIINFYSKK